MKLSKKLLTALLPITAASVLAPTLSSCNKGSGYDISFGSSVNCLDKEFDKTVASYRSVGDVQNGVKNHAQIESSLEIKKSMLPEWSDTTKQAMYYDLIASNAFKFKVCGTEKESIPFTLVWSISESQELTVKFQYKESQTTKDISGKQLGYVNKSGVAYIQIQDSTKAMKYEVKSYRFQNTNITGE